MRRLFVLFTRPLLLALEQRKAEIPHHKDISAGPDTYQHIDTTLRQYPPA